MDETKFKTKILLKETLKSMSVKDNIIINNRLFKANTVRSAATTLKAEGFQFEVSDRGRIDDVIVTRIK